MLKVGAARPWRADAARLAQVPRAQPKQSAANRKSVILVWLAGGPSHIDMYDLKPNAPAEVRGEFKPISTNVPGVQIGEHLPRQAKIFDKLAVVRSAYHTNAGHGMGSQWMQTGYQATIEVNDNIYPSTGSVVVEAEGAERAGLAGVREPAAEGELRQRRVPRGVVQPVRAGRQPQRRELPGAEPQAARAA